MSTITSPRPSNPSTSLTSSPTTSRTTSPAPQPRRANRTALRDYYNLKSTSSDPTISNTPTPPSLPSPSSPTFSTKISELDNADFDADAYVKSVLAGQGLEGVLRVERGLINEIKGLDGERKALVYDNYSKLITATDTIRRMRSNMDPLTPATSTLSPAVAHIAETAGGLAVGAKDGRDGGGEEISSEGLEERKRVEEENKRQRDTVRWVLGTPRRLGGLLDDGRRGEAETDWEEVKGLLERWKGVGGVEEIRDECERIMGRS